MKLRDTDYEILFIKDPESFFESLLLNHSSDVVHAKELFAKWLELYNHKYRETIAKSVETKYALRLEAHLANAERRGRVLALSSLPFRGRLKKHVDLNEVSRLLKELKGTSL